MENVSFEWLGSCTITCVILQLHQISLHMCNICSSMDVVGYFFIQLMLSDHPSTLACCVSVGTGVQIFGMTLVPMIFPLLGFLSPSNHGGFMTTMVLLWVFMGLFAGYSSARLYKMFKDNEWKKISLKTATMFPSFVSLSFLSWLR